MCTPGWILPTSFAGIPVFLVAKPFHEKLIPAHAPELITTEYRRQSFQITTLGSAVERRDSRAPASRCNSDEERVKRQVIERGKAGV